MPEPVRMLPNSSREALCSTARLDPVLQNLALRYAAGVLNAPEAAAFENRLAHDQDARDALSEAVRLSAAALGQSPPAPDPSFREAIRERLLGLCPRWLARRAYRGHPLAWTGVGAAVAALCTIVGLSLSDTEPQETNSPRTTTLIAQPAPATATATTAPQPRLTEPLAIALAPMPREAIATALVERPSAPSVAEIWADLSTPDHVEKAHDEEMRWRQKLREIGTIHPGRPMQNATVNDSRDP